ncbi:Ribosomal RNA small subunit methyltransferase G [BD1-7 clade bacterium]|uniref:Ribosomal RNA small subunit methyltransferase G n=1 Tax=BD1-7 clade bacterium TaxID=2029982 RepID=A0A5S9N0G1_9GAMM|nr:Ribosomal RNA small subunit methyltransferase G [BD1-7 clade bacterium]CAA0083196.1 Ribosomal RNA small subunit methyltransferase G [BD1-7 clade bacterium]
MPEFSSEIAAIASRLSLTLTETQIDQLSSYIQLLAKWNKAYNLTAIRNVDEMLDRHLLDSLSIGAYIDGQRLIDVGTGGGLPGLPLSIVYPDKHFTLLDSNSKKTRFLKQVVMELNLPNVDVVHSRVEAFQPENVFDAVLSRAFASLEDMVVGSEHLLSATGVYLAMKGIWPEMELQPINKPYKVQPIDWPGNDQERHLVIISQQ